MRLVGAAGPVQHARQEPDGSVLTIVDGVVVYDAGAISPE